MNNTIENKVSSRKIPSTIKGIIITFITNLFLIFIYSIILTYTSVSENTIVPVIIIITMISLLIGTSVSSIKIKNKGMLNGAIIGFIYMIGIYIISSIVKTGFSLNIYSVILIIGGILCGCIGRDYRSKYKLIFIIKRRISTKFN